MRTNRHPLLLLLALLTSASAAAQSPPVRVELLVCTATELRATEVRGEAFAEFGVAGPCGDPRAWVLQSADCAPSERHVNVRVVQNGEVIDTHVELGEVPRADRARVLVLAAEPLTELCVLRPAPEQAPRASEAEPPQAVATSPTSGRVESGPAEPLAASVAREPKGPWSFEGGLGSEFFFRGSYPLFGAQAGASLDVEPFRFRALVSAAYSFLPSDYAVVHMIGLGLEAAALLTFPIGDVRLGGGAAARVGFVSTSTSRTSDAVVIDDTTLPLAVLSLPLMAEVAVSSAALGVEVAPGVAVAGASLEVPGDRAQLRGFSLSARVFVRF